MPRPTSSARPLRPSEEENSLFAGHEHLGTSGPPRGKRACFFRENRCSRSPACPLRLLTTWPSAGRYRWLADRRSCDQCLSARACGSWETLRLHHHTRTARAGGGHFALLLQGPKCSRDQLARRLPWPERDQRRHGRLAAAPVPMFARNRHAMPSPCIYTLQKRRTDPGGRSSLRSSR